MRTEKFVDNHKDTHAAIARRVLQSHLSKFGPMEYLEAAAAGQYHVSSWDFMTLKFSRGGTYAEINVRLEQVGGYDEVEVDPSGNEWVVLSPLITANYPSHGSQDPATVLVAAALIHDVALLAAELQAEWPPTSRVWKLHRTSAQVVEAAQKDFLAKQQELARSLAERDGMKLRLGKEVWTDDLPAGIAPGTRYVEVWPRSRGSKEPRKFTVTVSDPALAAIIKRIR